MAERPEPCLDIVFRRDPRAMGRGIALSPASLSAAATAATLVTVLFMLLRRVTRWLALSELDSTEWELVREWDCRVAFRPPDIELVDTEGRWVSGREVCCISWGQTR